MQNIALKAIDRFENGAIGHIRDASRNLMESQDAVSPTQGNDKTNVDGIKRGKDRIPPRDFFPRSCKTRRETRAASRRERCDLSTSRATWEAANLLHINVTRLWPVSERLSQG